MSHSVAVDGDFIPFEAQLREYAQRRGSAVALTDGRSHLSWGALNDLMDRVAWALQRDGIVKNDIVAIASASSLTAFVAFLGVLRAGAVPALLTASASPDALLAMLADSQSKFLLLDGEISTLISRRVPAEVKSVALDSDAAGKSFEAWIGTPGSTPQPCPVGPGDPFNIIYSSGTTGTPKGIVQSHEMRQNYARSAIRAGLDATVVTIAATPLYSNTTLVGILPTLSVGGKVVLMPKFDARTFLALSEQEGVTHTMLVPVQYRRIMEHPEFDRFDLSAYRMKSSTSAPFPAWLKADVLKRWPGALADRYGMTEGGGSTTLRADRFPDKLHTVGQVNPGHEIRIIDEAGQEVPPGGIGEIVGRSPGMMTGYFGRPDLTSEAEWFDKDGVRFIRHGDIGRFDEDGFLILLDRSKDVIISGGFNIYPVDLEAELVKNPNVKEAAVVGIPSDRWGETPFAVIVAGPGADAEAILEDANARLGKTQRIAGIAIVDELPRSSIGKVLKRQLRQTFATHPIEQ